MDDIGPFSLYCGTLGDIRMTTFVGIIHIIVALVLIVLVLLQDSKSDDVDNTNKSSLSILWDFGRY
jgi:hypothetical protein